MIDVDERPYVSLLAMIILQAMRDAWRGCPSAALWLDECGADLAERFLGISGDVFAEWRRPETMQRHHQHCSGRHPGR